MKLLAKQNRELIMVNAQNTQNENDAEKIILKVPEQYEDFNKKIVFVTPAGNVWDIITNNEYLIPKAITKYKQVDFYIWLTQGNVDFRTQTKTLKFYHNVDASDEITDEEIGRVNTVVNLLEEEITKVENLESQIDGKLEEVDTAIDNIHTAIQETENLNLDAEKVGQTTTITLTKKDGTVKTVHVDDGVDLQFMWQGTSLGIKTAEQSEYTFVDLQGVQGQRGEQGEPFTIKKTYSSVAEMNADFNNMQLGDYVMIASTVEVEDNAKLYTRGESQWIFITDFSGATGIRGEVGLTPNIQIGTVTQGTSFNVTRTGTNENPILNFTLVKGDKGDVGSQGPVGATGNGISSIRKTGTNGLVDIYTITYTNGNTTTFTVTNGENADEITNLKNENAYLQNVVKQAFTETSASGTELTIDNTIEARMEMKLNGNTSQNGEPTPATPQEIHCVKGNNVVKVTNQNLFDGIFRQGTHISSVTSNRIINKNILEAKIGKTYTLSTNLPSIYKWKITNNEKHEIADSVRTINDTTYSSTSSVTVNCTENGYLRVLVARVDDKNITPNDIVGYKFQVEQGSTATTYEPHQGKEFPLDLGNIELCKIGDYQDYFYKSGSKWYLHKEIGKVVLNGTENWKQSSAASVVHNINLPDMLPVANNSTVYNNGISDQFKNGATYQQLTTGTYSNYYNRMSATNDKYMSFSYEFTTTTASWKNWLTTHNLTTYYVLETSTNTEITDTTLITQLDEISQALSQKGTTIISQRNDDLPFNLDVIALTK